MLSGRNSFAVAALAVSVLFMSSCNESVRGPLPVTEKDVIYKTIEKTELRAHIFEPENHSSSQKLPAIVFFFGGNWVTGSMRQFYPQCEYFASRGMVAIAVDYRIHRKHNAAPADCVTDAKSAIRWVRQAADSLGIDPEKIVAAGGSAGGHLAACTAMTKGLDGADEDLSISSVPNALVLFNPVVDTSEKGFGYEAMKDNWRQLSPFHNITANLPPTVVLHGTADTTVPFEQAERFCKAMTKAGNNCQLVPFKDQKHGFFNHFIFRQSSSNQQYRQALRAADKFLVSIGFLQGRPTI